ncbi:hypothetical protein HBI24_233450 [Parastagonospora nodorum]|nr:hypothetical protein HBH43_232070 [Parastagonospora nodorum]KAH4268270.1 hypothetical protein HBI03_062360 [Parastagonospora nodorum]KAH4279383.1 hypothetical protein HBI04_077800 [Parastagonospora nodorum]KAH4286103.1 hypothetical protein HBI01_244070 [Parastagonospora nodorum]KAH4312377.1 hypothetical protein HBI02_084260 [Parastagonospora nodorum]
MAGLMVQACERCWRRKQKCSREFPCSQCSAASATCTQRRLGYTAESPGSCSLSYIEALKHRIQGLQAQVQGEDVQYATPSSQLHTRTAGHDGAPQPHSASATLEILDDSQNDLHDTMQEASYLSLAAMAERTDRQPLPIKGLSILTLLYAAIGVSGANPSTSSETNTLRSGPLADFRKVHGVQSTVHDTTFLTETIETAQYSFPFLTSLDLKEILGVVIQEHEGDTLASGANESPGTTFMAYIALAIGLLQSRAYVYKEIFATEYALKAVDLIPQVFDHENDSTIVKCLTALTIYSFYTAFGGSTWHLLGLTMTRCIAAGMHTSRVSDPNADDEEKQKCYRVFWTLYLVDTYLSTSLDRPVCLSDDDITVSVPTRTDSNIQGKLRCAVEHAQLLRTIRQQPETDAWIHYINLRHWYETICPPSTPLQENLRTLQQSQLIMRGLIELIKMPSARANENWGTMLCGAEPDIIDYLNLFERHLLDQRGAPSTFDALDVFAAGILILQLPLHVDNSVLTRQKSVAQAINILTMLSVRYPSVQCLRDILSEYLAISTTSQLFSPASSDRLRALIGYSEVNISMPLQNLMMTEPRS